MRLSESISKNIMEVSTGGILNRFKIKTRRSVLFFEDIFANYIKECEKNGFEKDTFEIGEKWGNIGIQVFMKDILKRLPHSTIFYLTNSIWKNLNLVDEIVIKESGEKIEGWTKNEFVTRIIGKNLFIAGYYSGCLHGLIGKNTELLSIERSGEYYIYKSVVKGPTIPVKTKSLATYIELNKIKESKGFSLKEALNSNIFRLNENNILLFRERNILIIENTLFHLLGNGPCLDKLPKISFNFFRQTTEKSDTEEKINFLKNLLQIMGWGNVHVVIDGNKLTFIIKNPPYGLQIEKDNWEFIARVILGYLWTIKKNYKLKKIENKHDLIIYFSA